MSEKLTINNEDNIEREPKNLMVAVSELKGDNVLDEETIRKADLIELKFAYWEEDKKPEGNKKETLIHLLPYFKKEGSDVYVNLADKDFPEKIQLLGLPEKVRKINPKWVSLHLMYAASNVETASGNDQYDSIKSKDVLPGEEEFFKTVCQNIKRVKELFNEEVLLENVEYVPERYSHGFLRFITEPSFIKKVLEETDSGMLLDLEHAYVAAKNMDIRYIDYLKMLPLERVKEIHLSRPSPMKRSQALRNDWRKEPTKEDLKYDVLVDTHKPLVDKSGKFTKRVEVILGEIWGRLPNLEVITLELNLSSEEMENNVDMVRKIIENIKKRRVKRKNRNESE